MSGCLIIIQGEENKKEGHFCELMEKVSEN